jgi:hypothetical protein
MPAKKSVSQLPTEESFPPLCGLCLQPLFLDRSNGSFFREAAAVLLLFIGSL